MKAYDRAVKSRSRPTDRRYGGIVALFLTILLSSVSWAQNINNNGTIVNTGTMRVKGAVSGMPPAIDGVFEYFGANQNVPSSTYRNLVLTGSGTKTTVGGNFTVQQNITIAAPVTLKIPAPNVITLGGTLTESGYLEGSIQRSIDLSGGTTTSTFGNIGATISWTGSAPGLTTVKRTSGMAYTGNGNQSIRRGYEITTAHTAGLDVSFSFTYHESELNGRDESTLELWRSVDGGVTWRRQGGTVNTLLNTVTKPNMRAFSLLTASDAAHPLGPMDYEWVAKNLVMTAGNGGTGAINQTLAPFVVTVTDAYNNPISGITVTFALAGAPAGAVGQSISAATVITGINGQASTSLTLGNLVGTYTVTASAAGLVGSPITFTATATSAAAATIALVSGNNQTAPILSPLPQPFVVRVVDVGGNPVAGVNVSFSLASIPSNATGHGLSTTVVSTDASGNAASTLTLGNKVGTYAVTASVAGLSGSPIVFTATATAGAAASIVMTSGNNQVGVVSTQLAQPFVVQVQDMGGNAVSGSSVQFAIVSTPEGATGQLLSNTVATTDASGLASTVLTLGDKVGEYVVRASSSGLAGSPIQFRATAAQAPVGAPALITLTSGNNQIAPILTALPQPVVVTVTDANGRGVPGVPVEFAFTAVPANASGQAFSSAVVVTDELGRASNTVTLGNKVGVYRFTAASANLTGSPVPFEATAMAGAAASMVMTLGDNQIGVVSTRLTQPFVVQVLDVGANPVAGIPVQFSIVATPPDARGQTLSTSIATTDAGGLASTTLTLGDKVGEYVVRASTGGLAVQFRARATQAPVGAPVLIALTSGNNQTAPILTALPQPVVVTVTDANGRGVPGVPVEFAFTAVPANASGQVFGSAVVVTDGLGRAQNTVTLGNKVGVYRFTAASANLTGSPVPFEATATAGAPALLVAVSGNDQRGDPGAALPLPFVVRVHDGGANPVPGVSVQFAITTVPTGARGQRLSVQNAVTNPSGEATTTLTLGDVAGVYRVTASVEGIPPVVFSAEARFIAGDPNNDQDVNIADLTTLIDHILGRVRLVGADSIKADVNNDGAINILDVVLIRRYLLAEIASLNGDRGAGVANAEGLTPNLRMSASIRGLFEATTFGMSFSLVNDVPVKGLQLILKYRSPVSPARDSITVRYSRASMMTIPIHATGYEVRLVAYNLENITIEPGNGMLFRLPKQFWNENNLESFELIVSTGQGISQAVRGPVEIFQKPTVPLAFRLEQNYPNPFNPSTTIEFEVPDSPDGRLPVVIEVYDQVGAKVKTLTVGMYEAGRHRVVWNGDGDDGRRVSSGVYYYRLVSQGYQSAKKMILLR